MSGTDPRSAAPNPAAPHAGEHARLGTAYGAGAFLLWGVFPLYFHALEPAGAIEIVVNRVVWSLLVCLCVLAVTRQVGWVRPMLANPRQLGWLALAAACLSFNWGVYVYGVNSGHAVEAALGYFINPLVTVLLGVVVLREHLRRLQWAAVGLGAVAVVVLTVGYGHLPWIALALALSFASYGLLKKHVGANVGAIASLTTETAVLFPVAAATLVWLEVSGRGTFTEEPPGHGLLLATTGIVTVVPLLLFAAGARRVPLVTMGLLQFITPVLQLLCAVLVLGETVPASRWVGFAIVWAALGVLTVDALRSYRRAPSAESLEPAVLNGP